MKTSRFLETVNIHESWMDFLYNPQIQQLLLDIESEIGESYTPDTSNVLRFAATDLSRMKCVIWGRDPYPQLIEDGKKGAERVATGRAFEVNGADSWNDVKKNASLRNILKLLHKSYFDYELAVSVEEVREDIQSGKFPIKPPHEAFNYWERQGVLFLNRSLTCPIGNQKNASGQHEKLWTPFFEKLLEYVAETKPELKHFLWGTAKSYASVLIKLGAESNNMYISKHPSAYVGDAGGFIKNGNFLNNPCFRDTMNLIKWIR